jgi:hypothetical protein
MNSGWLVAVALAGGVALGAGGVPTGLGRAESAQAGRAAATQAGAPRLDAWLGTARPGTSQLGPAQPETIRSDAAWRDSKFGRTQLEPAPTARSDGP